MWNVGFLQSLPLYGRRFYREVIDSDNRVERGVCVIVSPDVRVPGTLSPTNKFPVPFWSQTFDLHVSTFFSSSASDPPTYHPLDLVKVSSVSGSGVPGTLGRVRRSTGSLRSCFGRPDMTLTGCKIRS